MLLISFILFSGDKSMVVDIDSPGADFPLFPVEDRWEADLEPGDILYIPALWFHNMKASQSFPQTTYSFK